MSDATRYTLTIKDPPRTTTRDEWKRKHRYSRVLGKMVDRVMQKNEAEFRRAYLDMLTYGGGVMRLNLD